MNAISNSEQVKPDSGNAKLLNDRIHTFGEVKLGGVMFYSIGPFQVFDKLAALVRSRCNPSVVIKFEFQIHGVQKYLGLAITLLGFALSAVVAIKTDSLSILLAGLAWIALYPILFWSNIKILKELQMLPLRFKSKVSNLSYIDILIVQIVFFSILIFFSCIYFSIYLSSINTILFGILYSAITVFFIPYLVRHEFIGLTSTNSAELWDDALALISMPLRLFCRLSGVMFAISNIFWILLLLYAIYLTGSGNQEFGIAELYMGMGFLSAGSATLYVGGPLLIYLITLPIFLLIRLIAQIAEDKTAVQDNAVDLRHVEVHINSLRGPESDSLVLNGEQILNLYRSGMIAPDTLVWTDGMTEWLPVSDLQFD